LEPNKSTTNFTIFTHPNNTVTESSSQISDFAKRIIIGVSVIAIILFIAVIILFFVVCKLSSKKGSSSNENQTNLEQEHKNELSIK
jgi:lipopolysaccharide/colanic/teichoic acid biosynthesis glycosyltransferase